MVIRPKANKKMKQTIVRNGLILAAFAMVTSGLIGLTYYATQDEIAKQQQAKLQGILNAIIAPSSYTNTIANDCTIINNAALLGSQESHHIYRALNNTSPVGVAIETTAPDGYSGNIHIVVGIVSDAQNNTVISGVRVLEHKETPGLGDKIDVRVTDWILSFNDKVIHAGNAAQFAVKKDGGQFDQFTGATISPRAVVKAVKRSAEYYEQNKAAIFAAANQCAN